jgi:hypothetical protein
MTCGSFGYWTGSCGINNAYGYGYAGLYGNLGCYGGFPGLYGGLGCYGGYPFLGGCGIGGGLLGCGGLYPGLGLGLGLGAGEIGTEVALLSSLGNNYPYYACSLPCYNNIFPCWGANCGFSYQNCYFPTGLGNNCYIPIYNQSCNYNLTVPSRRCKTVCK